MLYKMEQCIDKITPKSFHCLDFSLLSMFLIALITLSASTGGLESSESRNFKCDFKERFSSKESFVQSECLKRYRLEYSPLLSFYLFILATFGAVVFVCVTYAVFVKSRVEDVERNFNLDHPRPNNFVGTRQVAICHFLHLLARLTLAVTLLVLQHEIFYPNKFPTKFSCDWPLPLLHSNANSTYIETNYTSVVCNNLVASKLSSIAIAFAVVNIGFAVVTFGECAYLLCKVWWSRSRGWDFLRDSKFCCEYLLNKPRIPADLREYKKIFMEQVRRDTETINPVIPLAVTENKETRALDSIYVSLLIHTGRTEGEFKFAKTFVKNRGNVNEYQKFSNDSIQIANLQDLFNGNKDTQSRQPRTVLVIGGPGIGKTLLCHKIFHDWGKKLIGKTFEYAFLFHFRLFNSENTRNMSLCQLLQRRLPYDAPANLVQYLLNNAKKILILFDGLDELRTEENCTAKEQEAGNGAADVMPISSLFVKLVLGKVLRGVTLLITTRASGVASFGGLSFDRYAEIVGFSPEKVKMYVENFFGHSNTTSDKIWSYISDSRDLLNLCYIPANCAFVCFVLKMCISRGTSSSLFSFPTTLTELYQYTLRLFLLKHSPEFEKQDKKLKKGMIESDDFFSDTTRDILGRLQELAYEGMKEKRLVFDLGQDEVLENTCLLNVRAGTYEKQFYFIHLTMQEFLAARQIVALKEEKTFILSKALDKHWCLVIQFVAGLLKGYPERQKGFFSSIYQTLQKSTAKQELFIKDVPLLVTKCLFEMKSHEMESHEICSELASKLQDNITHKTKYSVPREAIPRDFSALFFFLKHLEPLRHLDIANDRHCFKSYVELGNYLNDRSPKGLAFRFIHISDEDASALANALTQKYCKLTKLSISFSGISNEGVSVLANAIAHENCELTKLSMEYNQISNEGVSALANALTHENCKLTKLSMRNNQISNEGASALANALTYKNCTLSELNICSNEVSYEGASALANALAHENCKITQLNVGLNKLFNEGASALANALTQKSCKLTKLDMQRNHINFCVSDISCGAAIDLPNALTDANCRLTKLDISSNNLSLEGTFALANALTHANCKLTELKINTNHMSYERAFLLANALTHENCKLTKLDVSSNVLSKTGASALADALKCKHCKLIELDISGNNLSNEGASALANALTYEHCKLTELTMSYNNIFDEGASALANALTHKNCKLTKLDMQYNKISNEGATALANAVTNKNCKLDMRYNKISNEGASALANAVTNEDCELSELEISDNKLSYELPLL